MFIKRLLAFVVAFTISFSSLAWAEGDENINSGSSGSETAKVYEEYAHRTFAYPKNQGIRTYLIDRNGVIVSDIVDILERYPWEIDSWGNGAFGGANKNKFEEFVDKFLWNRAKVGINKRNQFVYLDGYKTEGFTGSTTSYGVFGIYNGPARTSRNSGATRFIRLKEFNNSNVGKAFGSRLVLPSNLVGGNFYNGGAVLDEMLRSTINDGGKAVSGARYLVDTKIDGSFGGKHNTYSKGTSVYMYNLLDADKRANVEAGTKKISDYMVSEGYKLAFEPIYYIVPELTSIGENGFSRIPELNRKGFAYNYVFYGTTSSILYTIKNLVNLNKDYYGDIYKLYLGGDWNVGGLGVHTYQLAKDEEFDGRTIRKYTETPSIDGTYYSLGQLTGPYGKNTVAENGYGIMIFSIDDTNVYTSTFDMDTYGGTYSEGPAPKTTNDDGTFPKEYPSEGTPYKDVNKDHKFKIVKFYRVIDGEGKSRCVSNFVRENTVHRVHIVNEGDYKVDSWFTSSSTAVPSSQSECYDSFKSSKPNDGDKGNSPGDVEVAADVNINTLYVRYTKTEPRIPSGGSPSGLTLEEDELAHTYRLSDIKDLFTVNYRIRRKGINGINLTLDPTYERTAKFISNWTNSTYLGYKGNFRPREENHTISGAVDYTETETTHASGNSIFRVVIPDQDLGSVTPQLVFSVYRNRNSDKVTLYPKYNSSGVSELASIGITKAGYTPFYDRVSKTTGSGSYSSPFKVNYATKSKNPTYSYERWTKRKGSWEWVRTISGTLPILDGGSNFSRLNSYYNTDILTKYFLGSTNKGDSVPNKVAVRFTINGKTFGGRKFDYITTQLAFYPYTRMRYNTVVDENNKFVFVTSTNKSSLLGLTSVDSGIYKSKPYAYGIDIQSSQWSSHSRTVTGLSGIVGDSSLINKSLIPGGAVMDLKTANSSEEASEVWVGFRTYQVSLPDGSKDAYVEKTGISSTSDAKAEAVRFANEVKSVLGGYHIEKFAKTGIVKESNFKTGSVKVYPNGNFGGNQLSNDVKYYLRDDKDNTSQSSKIDVIGEEPVSQTVYRITMNSSNNLLNSKFGIITVEYDGKVLEGTKNTLLNNLDIKNLDDRTKIITNLANSLDNGGSSRDRNGNDWYYEGNEPIEVVMSTFAYQLGFGGSYSSRTEVIDPKLVGKLDNKGDLLNFDTATLEQKTRTIQYRTSSGSSVAPSSGSNYMGEFNGIKVRIPDMDNVLTSRVHYMGNNTVKDLN